VIKTEVSNIFAVKSAGYHFQEEFKKAPSLPYPHFSIPQIFSLANAFTVLFHLVAPNLLFFAINIGLVFVYWD